MLKKKDGFFRSKVITQYRIHQDTEFPRDEVLATMRDNILVKEERQHWLETYANTGKGSLVKKDPRLYPNEKMWRDEMRRFMKFFTFGINFRDIWIGPVKGDGSVSV